MRKCIMVIMAMAVALGVMVGLAGPSQAHTGDLKGTYTCQDDGTYLASYSLNITNVPNNKVGTFWWRIGTAQFQGTPTNHNGMTQWGTKAGNGTIVLGTQTLPGNTTTPPWVYAWGEWQGATNGSDGRADSLPGNCKPKIAKDAKAGVTVTPATCDLGGSASYWADHASLVGTLDQTPGNHTARFNADSGHQFADGSSTTTVSYTLEPQDKGQHCFVQPPDEVRTRTLETKPTCQNPTITYTEQEQRRSYYWNGSAYVLHDWPAEWTTTSTSTKTVDVPGCTRHVRVNPNKIDECNCYRDKVWLTYNHDKIKVTKSHPSKLVWKFVATGKVVNGHQMLLPSKIGGHSGWAVTQTYKLHTTNKICPCKERGDCHHKHPNFHPPADHCRSLRGACR